MSDEDLEIDVSECVFIVLEDEEQIWKGGDYKHAFFLRAVDPERRKVIVKATIDATMESAANLLMAKQFADEEQE